MAAALFGSNYIMWVYLFAIMGAIGGPACVLFIQQMLHQGGWGWLEVLFFSPWVCGFAGILLGVGKQMYDTKTGKMTETRKRILLKANVWLTLGIFVLFILSIKWSSPNDDVSNGLFYWLGGFVVLAGLVLYYRRMSKDKPASHLTAE